MSVWSPVTAIRDRREQIGLSQTELAAGLSVSKSLLSHIEAGKRQPTEEQLEKLAEILGMPLELLTIAGGRLPEDVRLALADNAAEAVAAIRQRTEAKAISYPSVPLRVPLEKEPVFPQFSQTVLPERIEVQKTSASYRAHSYHTKVPPEAIKPFIRAFSRPGDIVLDPFCGSGMTGVAALMEGRNALLSDLSPAAVHISRNYTTPCCPKEFAAAVENVANAVSPTMMWLYRPIGTDTLIEYTTWSDVFRCPSCMGRILYWDIVQRTGVTDTDGVTCPHCNEVHRKSNLEWTAEEPVQSQTSQGSNRINSHAPTRAERALIEEANRIPIPYWVPEVPFSSDREMWRAGHRAMGIASAADFYTRRNLHALGALRHAIIGHSEGRVREALMFAFTAAVNRASRRYQWNAKRPTNVMTGTLYVSSLRYEWNVWSLFRRKAADVLRYYRSFPNTSARAEVFQRSATDLDCLPDRSIDLVFMDPPFGANIFYADSSLLWDAWLGQMTDEAAEIVVNKHRRGLQGGKTIQDYGTLMGEAFSHAARVLRPGGRAVLAFSNSNDQVWESIQLALKYACLDTESVHILDKGQPSIKGVKGLNGKEHVTNLDLMLCLQHQAKTNFVGTSYPPPASLVDSVILNACEAGKSRNDEIYSGVVQAALARDYSVAGITMPVIASRCVALGASLQGGKWMIKKNKTSRRSPSNSLPGRPDFVDGYISDSETMPRGSASPSLDKPMPTLRAIGGRGSPFYLAHSYHTKVPPEAITPFIEYYTKPGDVVLDPFCGSGMTGVAAALAGRRAILNDLSPAAVHLAWNHTQPCDPELLAKGFLELESKVQPRFDSLYGTKHSDGTDGLIHWTLWSTKHVCPECSHSFLLWDVMDRATGRLGALIVCPSCKEKVKRSRLKNLGSVPAWIAYETADGKRAEKAPSELDLRHALSHARSTIDARYPKTPIGAEREMYIRCALQLQGVASVADFYTPRNLQALAILWQEIMAVVDDRVRRALAFAFTNTAWHGTRMRRFNARGGQRPLTGTLYIPQLSSEANVLEVMRNKIAQLQRYYRSYQISGMEPPAITLGSATSLSGISDGSIDYVFTDPPFGSNIFYADCNFIWESWLGRLTDATQEAVVNKSLREQSGGKSLEDYAGLIRAAMLEIARVLKPGGWATVVFHNTDAAVWQAIRSAAEDAGFSFHEAASLDRRQQSHKGYKGRSGEENVAHFDVVFNLRKSPQGRKKQSTTKTSKDDLSKVIANILKDPIVARNGVQGVHAELMRRLASNGSSVFVDYSEVRAIFERLVRPTKLVAAE